MQSAPTDLPQRVHSLDVLRGVAVLGILVVNVEQMFLPMLYANSPVSVLPGERGAMLAWLVTDAFFENKFVTLFSLLFGAGFALQSARASEGGRGFVPRYLRRLLLLAILGLIHATYFYAADVLLLYALVALALVPWRRAGAKTLALTGVILVTLTVAWGMVIRGPDPVGRADRHRAAVAAVAEVRSSGVLTVPAQALPRPEHIDIAKVPDWQVLEDGWIQIPETTYSQPLPLEAATTVLDDGDEHMRALVEYSTFSHGPVEAAISARLLFLASLILLYTPVYLGWRTLGLFLVGASLFAAGRLTDRPSAFWRRARFLGLGLGLPLTVTASAIRAVTFETQSQWVYAGNLLHDVSSLLLAAGFAGAVFLWVSAGRDSTLMRSLAAVGRTALTNYLGQSVLMSLLATSYGLGLFGDLGRMQLLALALVSFLGQMMVSAWWLRHFRSGPLEWVWRCFTYWRFLPLLRPSAATRR